MKQPTPRFTPLAMITLLACSRLVFSQQAPLPFLPEPAEETPPPPSIATPVTPLDGMTTQMPGPEGLNPAAGIAPNLTSNRDPFWPVRYVPRKPVITASLSRTPGTGDGPNAAGSGKLSPPDWDAARKFLDIQGVSLIGRDKQSNAPKYLAMIGGKLVEAGDTVSILFNDRTYRWKITGISATGISLIKTDVRPE